MYIGLFFYFHPLIESTVHGTIKKVEFSIINKDFFKILGPKQLETRKK